MNNRYYSYSKTHPLAYQYGLGDALKTWVGNNNAATSSWFEGLGSSIKSGLKANGYGIADTAINIGGKLINPKGNTSKAGKVLSGLGTVASVIPGWGQVASLALKGVGKLTDAAFGSNLNQEAINGLNSDLSDAQNSIGSSLNWNALADNVGLLSGIDVEGTDIGSQGWFSHAVDNEREKLREKEAQAQGAIGYAKDNVSSLELRDMMSNALAFGGPIFKTDYDMGLSFINAGGTHESNPYGGVTVGIAPDGLPNQVEEDEVIFNDYVFSNRLKVPKAIRNKYRLRKVKDLSFADALKQYIRKNGIEERNNDPIANRGLDAFASELAMEQEMLKMKRRMRRQNNFALGGHMFPEGGPYILYDKAYQGFDNLYKDDSPYMKALNYLNTAGNEAERDALIADINAGKYNEGPKNMNGVTINANNWYGLATDHKYGPVHNALISFANRKYGPAAGATDTAGRTTPEFMKGTFSMPAGPFREQTLYPNRYKVDIYGNATNTGKRVDTSVDINENGQITGLQYHPGSLAPHTTPKFNGDENSGSEYEGSNPDDLRRMGLYANTAGLLYNLFDPYRPQRIDEVRPPSTISAPHIGDYLEYTPYDINYATSQQDANSAATRNAIMQSALPGRDNLLLANDFNNNATRGATRRQALEYNDNARKVVTDFNRGTNQFNAQMDLNAAARNQQARQQYYEDRMRQAQLNTAYDFQHKQARDQAIGQGIASIADYLNDMGREDIAENQVDAVVKSGVPLNESMTNLYTTRREREAKRAAERRANRQARRQSRIDRRTERRNKRG